MTFTTTLANLAKKKPSPGDDKVPNIATAKDQEKQLRDWIDQAKNISSRYRPSPRPAR